MNNQLMVLLIGGYGIVGKQVAVLLNQYYPEINLIIGGRNLTAATQFANSLSNATAINFDIHSPQLPLNVQPQIIVTLANDPDNKVLHFAIENQIAYLDITRWTDKLKTAITHTHSFSQLHAPIVFSSSWMAGIIDNIIIQYATKFSHVENIDINILYSMQDKAGINSVEYMDRMLIPFEVIIDGHTQSFMPFSDGKQVTFKKDKHFWVYRFDTPDQLILPLFIKAKSVSTRIGFNNNMINRFFHFLIRSGIWHLISGKSFNSFRQKLLYSPGKGDEHNILIEINGLDSLNNPIKSTLSITSPKGQSHLTAIGTFIQIHSILNMRLTNQVYFGETLPDKDFVIKILKTEGINIDFNYGSV